MRPLTLADLFYGRYDITRSALAPQYLWQQKGRVA